MEGKNCLAISLLDLEAISKCKVIIYQDGKVQDLKDREQEAVGV
jgi:hypothetical protein